VAASVKPAARAVSLLLKRQPRRCPSKLSKNSAVTWFKAGAESLKKPKPGLRQARPRPGGPSGPPRSQRATPGGPQGLVVLLVFQGPGGPLSWSTAEFRPARPPAPGVIVPLASQGRRERPEKKRSPGQAQERERGNGAGRAFSTRTSCGGVIETAWFSADGL